VKWQWKKSMPPAASSHWAVQNLEMIYADSESKPEKGVAEAERLINTEKVNVLTGCWNSAVTYPTTAVAERYGIPFIVPVSVADKITEQGFKTVFRIAAKDSWWTRDQFAFLGHGKRIQYR
jgi:branched-chain amino acid transport system substrate-binding protein